MDIEVKKYLRIGIAKMINIKVYPYDKVGKSGALEEIEPLYEGPVDEAPEEIKEMYYVKVSLGNPTIYYV